jgi:hypothetical protein
LKTISLEDATAMFEQFRGYHPFATPHDLKQYLQWYGFLPLWSPTVHFSGGGLVDES